MSAQLEMTYAAYPHAPGHKHTDTSLQAAILVTDRAEYLRPRVLAALQEQPRTADELAELLGEHPGNVRPRCSELRHLGKVRDTGQRRVNAWGHKMIVWEAI